MFWYEADIIQLEQKVAHINNSPNLVFYGSSTMRLWDSLEKDFQQYNAVNLGFGGSTLAACVWFYDRIFANLKPSSIVIYAGDNDLGDNRHPEEVYIFFEQLLYKIRTQFGNIPVFYISIKPSINRFHIIDRIKYANKIISQEIYKDHNNSFYINLYEKMLDDTGFPLKQFFQQDGLHLNSYGYGMWKEVITKYLSDYLPLDF